MKKIKTILCVDVEATCWDTDSPNKRNEIIEFGVTEIDIKSHSINCSVGILVKPSTMEISKFCTKLTTITSEMIEEYGVSFSKATKVLIDTYDSRNCVFASWGAYDANITEDNCRWNKVAYPFDRFHLNIKYLFKAKYGYTGALDKCAADLQIPFEGTHHRGVDDSKMAAKVLLHLLG